MWHQVLYLMFLSFFEEYLSPGCSQQPFLRLLSRLCLPVQEFHCSSGRSELYCVQGCALSHLLLSWIAEWTSWRSPQLHRVTLSSASCWFWLNFPEKSWIHLVIAHYLMSLDCWWEQAANSLSCLGTVGLCPAEWSPCPCLCADHPELLAHLPSWSCPILAAPC